MDFVKSARPTNLTACAFSNGGRQFLGWATAPDGAVVYGDGAEVRNLSKSGEAVVLYAVWDSHEGVQLWENGPYWAETNVGAENPWDSGYYFWWGDTLGYKRVGNQWVASDGSVPVFNFAEGNTPTWNKDAAALQGEGWTTASGNLAPAHDAASVHWGNGWRIPTLAEIDALIANTTTEWTTMNGVPGHLVKGKGAYSSASIFLPAAGYGYGGYLSYFGSYGSCWSSSPSPDLSSFAWSLDFDSGHFYRDDHCYRYYGQSVRPLRGFAK